jgi:thiosulfate/3-mercaptopyruvate sulfurtransferase
MRLFQTRFHQKKRFNEEAQKLGINSNSAIVVYDDKGIYSSARCWYLFKAFGHQNIAVLDGGLPEWISRGFSVERKKDISYPRGDFKGYYHSKYFNFFDDIEQLREDPGYQILDARSGDRFNGLVAEPREGLRSGNIPNSRSLPFKDLLDGNGMKPVNELKEILRAYNIEDKSLVFSCGSGITACVLALAAAMAGYKNTSVYDGSWTEYGTLTHD